MNRSWSAPLCSFLLCLSLPTCALEEMGDADIPELDFRNIENQTNDTGASLPDDTHSTSHPTSQSRNPENAYSTDNVDKNQRKIARRVGSTTHLSLGYGQSSRYKSDYYTASNSHSYGLSASILLSQYLSIRAGAHQGKADIDYTTQRMPGPGALDHTLIDVNGTNETDGYHAGLTVSLFGDALSTPYIGISRSKTHHELSSDITFSGYYSSFGPPAIIFIAPLETLRSTQYSTTWKIGYEHAINHLFSVSAGFSHGLIDERNVRSYGASLDLWLSQNAALSISANRGYDTETNGFGTGVVWTL